MYERKRFFRTDYFTFCRKGQFLPGLPSEGSRQKQMPRPYPVRFYHHGSRPGRSIPEIQAKHVDAAIIHEAAIGRINDEQLLKLRTLGMTEAEAENVIIENFLS